MVSVHIEPSVLTDHQAIYIKIDLIILSYRPNRDYWKLNQMILQNKKCKDDAAVIIGKYWREANLDDNFGSCWELMKFEVRKLAIILGKKIAKDKREEESRVITRLIKLSEKVNLTGCEFTELTSLQLKLDKMYEDKAKGAFVRSRRKWLEKGKMH